MKQILIQDEYRGNLLIGFINSDGDYEYTTYLPDDGGVLDADEDVGLLETLLSEVNYPDPTVYTLTDYLLDLSDVE